MQTSSARKFAHRAMMSIWSIKSGALPPRIIVYRPDAIPNETSLLLKQFRSHLQWIKDQGAQGTSVKEAVLKIKGRTIQDANQIAIAIDVEENTTIDAIVPVLRDFGFSATFFIDTSTHGASKGCLPAIRSAVDEGMEVGSRGNRLNRPSHKRNGGTEAFLRELVGGKHRLEDIVGCRVDAYAYPGRGRRSWARTARRWIMRLGFECAATSNWNRLSDSTDPFNLPRCEILPTDSIQDFIDIMTGKRDYLKFIPL